LGNKSVMRLSFLPLACSLSLALPLLGLAAPPSKAPSASTAPPAAPPGKPLPYVTQHALGGLRFEQPLGIVSAPGETDRLFILEKPGRMQVITHLDQDKPERATFLDLTAEVGNTDVERGLLSVAFHPDFAHNHYFYVWLTATNADQSESYDRLSRFTVSATNPNVADPKSEQIIINQIDRAPNHNGGELHFGPDGDLYLSMGDEGKQNDFYKNGQHIDKNFFGCIIRIDVDQRPGSVPPNPHPAVTPGTYTIPKDNPFLGATSFIGLPVDPKNVRTEFFAVGLRNPWRMAFDHTTGLLWEGDVGEDTIEEVNLIKSGGNYGWDFMEGDIPGPNHAAMPSGLKTEDPLYMYKHTNAADNCIIGGYVYRGKALPALDGHYLFGDYVSGRIWSLSPVDGSPKVTVEMIARERGGGIVAFGQDPRTGDVLIANLAPNSGYIERLVPAPAVPAAAPAPAAP
jgi:glucose/arabinose dehydrogenase